MQRTPPQIDRSLETEFGDEMPTTRDSLATFVNSVFQQREAMVIEQLTSTVQRQMASSLEEFAIQFRISEVPTVFNTPATSANSQSSIMPNQPVFLAPTTTESISTPSTVLAATIEKISKVPRAEYTKTSTQSSDSLAKNTITFQSQDSKKKMAHLDSILRSEYLLSLFDGTSLKPVISTDNPFGYTPNDIAMDPTTGIQIIIKADDIFHYDYDLKRSYQLLLLVFAESLHYICKADIVAGNSINIYKAMHTHLFGKQTSDVQRETNALTNHKVNFKDNLRQNMDILNQLFTNV